MTLDEIVARLIEEHPFPAKEAAKVFGTLSGGRPVAPSTVSRWAIHGHRLPDGRRVKLEALRFGGKLCTTKQAIIRFLVAQQPAESEVASAIRSPGQRRRESTKVMDSLTEAGAV